MPYYLNFTLATNQLTGNGDASQVANVFPNTVISGTGAIDGSSTTVFVSDANLVSATKSMAIDVDPSFIQSSTDMTSQDIRDFLAKPVILSQNVFSVGDTYSSPAFPEYIVPADVLNVSNLMFDKVKGYLGFRATVVLRLVANATRFQQGRYNLQLVPTGGAVVTSTNSARHRVSAVTATLTQRTQLPHVELDLSCDTEAVLRYPFNSATNFYPFNSLTVPSSFGAVGLVKIYPYAALEAGSGNTTCGFTLWAHFEDVVLIGAAVPQSGRAFSAKSRKKTETEVEQDSSNMGPISSALMKVSNAANVFTKVPLLSSYASMTSWYSELLANAASAFGWARPINLEHSGRVTQNYLPYSANVDSPDNSFPLSFSYKNQVGKAGGFSGTDLDEMDFSFLCTIPAFYAQATWLPNQVSGTSLISFDVGPNGALVSRGISSRTIYDLAPYQFISNLFAYWRGSFVYKLKFVKTEFHSGRLAVSFSPRNTHTQATNVPTLAETAWLHRQIIDIRECNEFTFQVPFISVSPYVLQSSFIGRFTVHILDPLVAPDTAPQAIQILIETSMGPDAEFAVPKNRVINPIYGLIPQSGEPFESNVCANYRGTIGSVSTSTDECSNSLFCIGERISSLRTLLKMPTPIVPYAVQTASNYFNIVPPSIPYTWYNSAGPTYIDASWKVDLYGLINTLYVYGRGGIRLKFLDTSPVTTGEPFVVYSGHTIVNSALLGAGFNFSATDGANTNGTDQRNLLPSSYYRAGYSGEVQVPQYSQYHSRVNSDVLVNATGVRSLSVSDSSFCPNIYLSRATVPNTVTLCGVLRSGADDANCGVFLAIPPVTIA